MTHKITSKATGRIGPRASRTENEPSNPPSVPRVAFVTLGCPKNQVDSEVMLGRLARAGFATTPTLEEADVAVINTCAFLEAAVSEGIDTILAVAALKEKNLKALVVTGCMSQRYSGELLDEIPEIDAILGTGDVDGIVDVLQGVLEANGVRATFVGDPNRSYIDPSVRVLSTPRHSPYLQISQGCSNTCTFCIIPALRGPGRSRDLDGIVAEAKNLVQAGARELVVIGQDTTALGLDTEGRPLLGKLLRRLDELEGDGLKWVRLMYTNPLFWDETLIDEFAASRTACPYVDMPIQHSVDTVLHRMGRGYTGEHCRWLARRLREVVPHVALRTSIIVGFPGETDDDHREVLDFLEEVRFDRLVAFPYFPEDGTSAFKLGGRVQDDVQKVRLETLLRLQAGISREKNRSFAGQTLDVLVDDPGRGSTPARGRSYREAPEVDGVIRFPGFGIRAGQFIRVRITAGQTFDLTGVPVPGEASACVS